MSLRSKTVTWWPTILLLALFLIGGSAGAGLESAVVVGLLVVQAIWLFFRFGFWLKDVVEHAVGMDKS